MTVPQPEQDSILMREHAFRNSRDLGIILTPEPESFQSIKKVGLGTFNYKLVDLKSVNSNRILGGYGKSTIPIYSCVLILAASILFLAACYILFRKYTTKTQADGMKEKVGDYYEQQYSDLGLPQLVSTSSSASVVSSFPDTPKASLINLHALPINSSDDKYALNAV